MPGSSSAGRQEAIEMLFSIDEPIDTILDVGPGAGQWYDLLHQWFPDSTFDAIEIFQPYIERYGLENKYRTVYNEDARTFSTEQYDLIIYGDVLEHMEKPYAIAMVKQQLHKYALISIPIGECPQDPTEENPYEEHLATWSTEEILQTFPVVYPYYAHVHPPPHYGRGVFLLEKRS